MPSVRFATRVITRPSVEETLAAHRAADFDPERDVVLPGPVVDATEAAGANRVRPERVRETTGRLVARVDAPAPGVLVWSRTFFGAWWATVDGRPAETVRADGHLVGVRVPAGRHEVEIGWSRGPVAVGGVLALVGLGLAAGLRARGPSAPPTAASAAGTPP